MVGYAALDNKAISHNIALHETYFKVKKAWKLVHYDGVCWCDHVPHHLEAANPLRILARLVSGSAKLPALGQHPAGLRHCPLEHRFVLEQQSVNGSESLVPWIHAPGTKARKQVLPFFHYSWWTTCMISGPVAAVLGSAGLEVLIRWLGVGMLLSELQLDWKPN